MVNIHGGNSRIKDLGSEWLAVVGYVIFRRPDSFQSQRFRCRDVTEKDFFKKCEGENSF